MAYVSKNKLYIIIDNSSGLIEGHGYPGLGHDDAKPEPTLGPVSGKLHQMVTASELGGLTPAEFIAKKKAVLVAKAFDRWEDRATAPVVSVDINPKADGSNTPLISISGGPADSKYKVIPSRVIDCELASNAGTLDASGDASFKIRVYGVGPLSISIEPDGHDEFKTTTFIVVVASGTFA